MKSYRLVLCAWGAMTALQAFAQEAPKPGPGRPARPMGPGASAPATPGAKPPVAGEPKKYDDVVTKDFTTMAGVFAVHKFEEKVLFEIPTDKLGKLFMWRAEVAKGPGGSSWGGAALGEQVVRFERRGNKIYLWSSQFDKRSDGKAFQASSEASSHDSILAVFPVEAEGKDRSAVIALGEVFVNGLPDLSIIAALLTILGYSINDTVVVFDRLRENLVKFKTMPLREVMNLSVNETLSRTLMTSVTTLIAVGAMLIFGGDVIRGFTFAIFIGIVLGTYSSVYVAKNIVLMIGLDRSDKPKSDKGASHEFANIDA